MCCCSCFSPAGNSWVERSRPPQKPPRACWFQGAVTSLCCCCKKATEPVFFPSMHPVAVLNSMFPLLHPVWQEHSLFWKIRSRRERLKIPLRLNKGARASFRQIKKKKKTRVNDLYRRRCALCINTEPLSAISSYSPTCQAWHSLIKLVNTSLRPSFRLVLSAITPGCTAGCRSLPLTSGHSHSPVLCSSHAIQLTSAALEIQYYHIIYEGWPSGMQLKQEYQLSSPAVLLAGLPLGLSASSSAPPAERYLQVQLQWVLFIRHLNRHRACTVGYFVLYLQLWGEQILNLTLVFEADDSPLVYVKYGVSVNTPELGGSSPVATRGYDLLSVLAADNPPICSPGCEAQGSSQCLDWQIRLLAESHYFQKAH